MNSTTKPSEYVSTHPITLDLKHSGLTDEQLRQIRFHPTRNVGWPFDLWSISGLPFVPREEFGKFKAYATLKWLVEDPPDSRDKQDAWRYLNDQRVTQNVEIGLRARAAQQQRARRPRGKITDDGKTLLEVIAVLVPRAELELSAKQIWPRLYAKLDELGLEPQEVPHPSGLERSAYIYTLADGHTRRITYGRFANLVAQVRKISR